METFYSNGKLLLTGEYVVLDGALSLAIPTKYGQSLTIESIDGPKIIWKSFDYQNTIWFESSFFIKNSIIEASQSNEFTQRLLQILNAVKQLNPQFLKSNRGFKITSKLDFPNNWGLGTSSTLINNIANWAKIDAYQLLEVTFGGSGYDIACAQNNFPITYQICNEKPAVNAIDFNPSFKKNLYFIHLNKKQNSRDGIKHYHENKGKYKSAILEIDKITTKMIGCDALKSFEELIIKHENMISKITNQTPVKQALFDDFDGAIKSLGAWGGDFILATSQNNPSNYFKLKGFKTIISYEDMIL